MKIPEKIYLNLVNPQNIESEFLRIFDANTRFPLKEAF